MGKIFHVSVIMSVVVGKVLPGATPKDIRLILGYMLNKEIDYADMIYLSNLCRPNLIRQKQLAWLDKIDYSNLENQTYESCIVYLHNLIRKYGDLHEVQSMPYELDIGGQGNACHEIIATVCREKFLN